MASEEKKAAALAAARKPDASAARTAPATWPISVHLTGFAPGCEGAPIHHKRRWHTFYGNTPGQVVMATLRRLKLSPAAVKTSSEVNGDVNLLAPVPPELLKLMSSAPGEPVPFAIFWDGLQEADVKAVLADLVRRGWKPDEMPGHPHAA